MIMLLGALSAEAQNNAKQVRPADPPVGYARTLGRTSIELPDTKRPPRPVPAMSPAWRSLRIAEPPFSVSVLVYSPDAPQCAGRVYIARLLRIVYEGDTARYEWAEGHCGASAWPYAVAAWMPIVEPEKPAADEY